MQQFVGVLGGMGPMATADFMQKIVKRKSVLQDQDHIPLMIYSFPQIPDRSEYILNKGKSPLAELASGVSFLESNGASCIVIPCNTAHFWYDDLRRITRIPILNIVDSVAEQLKSKGIWEGNIVSFGTDGTRASQIYEKRLGQLGFKTINTPDKIQSEYIMPTIHAVKQGKLIQAKQLFHKAISMMVNCDLSAVILACTELPVIFSDDQINEITIIDSTEALALSTIKWFDANITGVKVA